MAAKKNEEVSASFHYLTRTKKDGEREMLIPFTAEEFNGLFDKMASQKPIDLSDEKEVDRLRFRAEVPLVNVKRADARTITGTFKASYWGHAYDNTVKGRIPAISVNLRPFHFLIYLSESGRIYIGSQYLGLFGGYESLKKTLVDMLPNRKQVRSRSFRLGAAYYRNAEPREIRVNVANKSTSLAGRSSVRGKMTIALSRASKSDPLVEKVKTSILPFFGGKQSQIQRAVADLMNESDIIEIDDEDIVDCTVLAEMNGKTRTIHMFETGHHASKFSLDVPVDEEGHPANDQTCKAIVAVLRDQVISIAEDE
ncbi:hypothetical protein GF108_12380 [Phyllobacterium sp. SYP-B3895]|uniref:hypothetical protein n=1 Tax=Phyllobacterium sp. SYP-B3895 TaxID=2663240 RepID=UPI0012998F9E|nr:hypothetical protein [Phyllobacterium sp. SYP-B3895]MRG56375.1 hypothetical protein [Phyllobacterium sp. SYP-B3895]